MARTIAGSLIGIALGANGKKVEEQPYVPISPDVVQQDTIAGNQAILPQAQALANAVNQGNAAQLRAILNKGGNLDLAESFVNSRLRGELSQADQRNIQNSVAGESARLGLGGTQFQVGQNALQNYNLTSQYQQQGFQAFGQLAQLTTPQLVGAQAMFFTPQQRLQTAFNEREYKGKIDLLNSQIRAAPNPNDVALAEGLDNFFAFWANVGGAALGGASVPGKQNNAQNPNSFAFGGSGEASQGANSFGTFNNSMPVAQGDFGLG